MSYGFIPDGVTPGQLVGNTFNHPQDGSGLAGVTDVGDPSAQWILATSAHDPVNGPPDILPNTAAGFGGAGSVGPLRTTLRPVAAASTTEAVSEKAIAEGAGRPRSSTLLDPNVESEMILEGHSDPDIPNGKRIAFGTSPSKYWVQQ